MKKVTIEINLLVEDENLKTLAQITDYFYSEKCKDVCIKGDLLPSFKMCLSDQIPGRELEKMIEEETVE